MSNYVSDLEEKVSALEKKCEELLKENERLQSEVNVWNDIRNTVDRQADQREINRISQQTGLDGWLRAFKEINK